jgi:ribosomal 50S subunit-associated protein YjgA (DUF615 family)
MKMILFGTFSFLALVTGCASVESQSQEAQRQLDSATQANSDAALNSFLEEYPTGPYADEARFRLVMRTNTLAGFEAYLAGSPPSPGYAIAMNQLEKLMLEHPSGDQCEEFLSRFPTSQIAPQVSTRLRKLRFEGAEIAGTLSAYDAFLQEYPKGEDSDYLRKVVPSKKAELLLENAERLGQLAVDMCVGPRVEGGLNPQMGGYEFHVGGYTAPPTDSPKLAEFRQLLKDGADSSLIRIAGLRPPTVPSFVPIDGVSRIDTRGSSGFVVPAASDTPGMTLLEYLDATNQQEAHDLLEQYLSK